MLASMDFCRTHCRYDDGRGVASPAAGHSSDRLFSLLTPIGRDRWCSYFCLLLVRPYLADPFEDFNGEPLLGQGRPVLGRQQRPGGLPEAIPAA